MAKINRIQLPEDGATIRRLLAEASNGVMVDIVWTRMMENAGKWIENPAQLFILFHDATVWVLKNYYRKEWAKKQCVEEAVRDMEAMMLAVTGCRKLATEAAQLYKDVYAA
ncbi:hypothetical protein HGA91_04875 [candidate division WWE3 bacterium]|nr:hypothetical protein [candidate division WWE3 bacterium]